MLSLIKYLRKCEYKHVDGGGVVNSVSVSSFMIKTDSKIKVFFGRTYVY